MNGDGRITFIGRIKDKLVAAKEKTARERRLQSNTPESRVPSDRLPPGQRLVEKWPVLDLGVTPEVSLDAWHLVVDGLVENEADWSWGDFQVLPQSDIRADVHCVTTWSLYDSVWRGVSTREVIARVRPKPDARFVLLHSYDGYTTNVPLARFAETDALLAHARNGESIGASHGGPVRVVIPSLYFWKSAKWVRRITFAAEDRPGYWEVRGYHNDADPWKEERYG